MSKEEIGDLLEECGRWESNNQVFHFDIESAKEKVLELIKEVAIGFCEWAVSEGWQHYDGHDRWINLENGRTVLETKQLYQQYLKNSGL